MIVTVEDLRARYAKALDRIADATIETLIVELTGIAERYRGIAYESTTSTVRVRGTGTCSLVVPHQKVTALSALVIDGAVADHGAVTVWPEGVLERTVGWPNGAVVDATVTHGYVEPPSDLIAACGEFVRSEALALVSNAPRNTISWTDDSGYSYRESTPDFAAGRPTGWISVDRRLNLLPDFRVPL